MALQVEFVQVRSTFAGTSNELCVHLNYFCNFFLCIFNRLSNFWEDAHLYLFKLKFLDTSSTQELYLFDCLEVTNVCCNFHLLILYVTYTQF